MPHLEPSYLRYIYDGLEKGGLHPDNSAALPEGLIGLYDEAFDEIKPVRERQKLLETFAIWALLKKNVSDQFIAEILEIPSQEIVDFITTYSSWFTSPESGKYQLYHERLKVYLLQKLSEQEITTLHNKLITRLEQAIKEQKADEFEIYGLEFLSVHYFTTAMIREDATKLIAFSYDQNHWQSQLKLSKGFEWTKKSLKQVMTWASKFNDEEVIECGLQMVDLHHQEQNDAPQIVALVADGDIEVALKRIEAFGGNDKEGIKRRFILYMLSLMELTLLESKDKPFRKEAIEKILKHFDKNIPVDHSIFNWNDFFPSYLMFMMACECADMNINYLLLFENSTCETWGKGFWEGDWISENGPYTKNQFEVLFHCGNVIKDKFGKSNILVSISIEQAKQGYIDKALECLNEINDDWLRDKIYFAISSEFGKQDNIKEAQKYANYIGDNFYKSKAIIDISSALFKQSKIEEASILIKDALSSARSISYDIQKSSVFASISTELAKQGLSAESTNVLQEALGIEQHISDDVYEKDELLVEISIEMAKQQNISEALVINSRIKDEFNKNISLLRLYSEFFKKDNIKKLELLMEKVVVNSRLMSDRYRSYKIKVLLKISNEMFRMGKQEDAYKILIESLEIANLIIDYGDGSLSNQKQSLRDICSELTFQGRLEDASVLLRNILTSKIDINVVNKIHFYLQISSSLANLGQFANAEAVLQLSLTTAQDIEDIKSRNSLLHLICLELANQLKLDEAIECLRNNNDKRELSNSLRIISVQLAKFGHYEKASTVLQEALLITHDIENDRSRNAALRLICCELVKQLKLKKALLIARGINDNVWKSVILASISSELVKQGHLVKAKTLMQEAINCIQYISNEDEYKSFSLSEIAFEQAKQGLTEEAIALAHTISDGFWSDLAFSNISCELAQRGMLKESLACAKSIKHQHDIVNPLAIISSQLAKDTNKDYVEKIGMEINSIAKKFDLWNKISNECKKHWKLDGKNTLDENGYYKAMGLINKYETPDAQYYFKLGLIEQLNINHISKGICLDVLKNTSNEMYSIKHVLQLLTLNQIFFSNLSAEKIKSYNRTLNIQWAIDIKNQLPN